jgi:hypothetical protein
VFGRLPGTNKAAGLSSSGLNGPSTLIKQSSLHFELMPFNVQSKLLLYTIQTYFSIPTIFVLCSTICGLIFISLNN